MRILLIALFSALLASGGSFFCATDTVVVAVQDEDFSDIEDPLERWRAHDIHDYQIDQMYGCFCAPPHRWTAIIEDDQLVDVIVPPVQGTNPDEMHERAMELAWTIEEGFEQIRSMPGGQGHGDGPGPADLQVTYHPEYGYPERVYIDWYRELADDELHLEMSNLEELNR